MTWLMTPIYAGRGLRNLLTLAEERHPLTPAARSSSVVVGSPTHTEEL
jgi:hypothetical protein